MARYFDVAAFNYTYRSALLNYRHLPNSRRRLSSGARAAQETRAPRIFAEVRFPTLRISTPDFSPT